MYILSSGLYKAKKKKKKAKREREREREVNLGVNYFIKVPT